MTAPSKLPLLAFSAAVLTPGNPVAAQDRPGSDADLFDRVEHYYADSDGVPIHYVTTGEGPLVVMIHGFPDFWYSWRDQMVALEDDYRVANPDQARNSQYARNLQQEGSHEALTADGLAGWVQDEAARARYIEAFERSDFEAMAAYCKANYPRPPYTAPQPMPRVRVPVLQIHGLEDQFLLASALNDTWSLLDADYTLVTLPGAGHFVQQDASELVTRSIRSWLSR